MHCKFAAMLKIILAPLLFFCLSSSAQTGIKVIVKIHDSGEFLAGATVRISGPGGLDRDASTDSTGTAAFKDLFPAIYSIKVSHVGFETANSNTTVAEGRVNEVSIELEAEHEEEEEVIIQSTRSSRSISDIPTRVEFIAGEELDEKSNMKPGDIRMVLNESTGIQTQQTSATSANAAIRIQGLDGRYTQILKDGFPTYAGMASGLGLLQTPPLDLQQIEVIKGSASTLYGGGAIAGLVNLISKKPREVRELNFHLDLTSAGGVNASGFFSKRINKFGLTFFGSRNSNKPYDPADIGLTAIPKFTRYTITPRFYYYFTEKTELSLGVSYSTEERIGGEIEYIRGNKPSGFFESNHSERMQSQLKLEHLFGDHSHLTLKTSFSVFYRDLFEQNYRFNGIQHSSFSEVSYASHGEDKEWIFGVNFLTDDFEESYMPPVRRDYREQTAGAFVQSNWKFSPKFILESGIRADHVKDHGVILLPRISGLFKFSPMITSRIGGGLGYKTPNVFTEESERLQYRNVLPVDPALNYLEKSYGMSADLNIRANMGEVSLSLNQLFFYTRIQDPLILQPEGINYRFVNMDGHFDSRGLETNLKLSYHDFKLFLGYTHTDAYLHQGVVEKQNFLTPRHRINSVLLYEVHEKIKIGLEGYYYGKQLLSDNSWGRSYWVTGLMVEKFWERFSLYVNFENFLDARQTRYGTIYTGTISSPVFRDLYAPLDGFVVNGGIKLRL